jgi:hypothetical protein
MIPSQREDFEWWKCRSRSPLTFPSKRCKNHRRNEEEWQALARSTMEVRECSKNHLLKEEEPPFIWGVEKLAVGGKTAHQTTLPESGRMVRRGPNREGAGPCRTESGAVRRRATSWTPRIFFIKGRGEQFPDRAGPSPVRSGDGRRAEREISGPSRTKSGAVRKPPNPYPSDFFREGGLAGLSRTKSGGVRKSPKPCQCVLLKERDMAGLVRTNSGRFRDVVAQSRKRNNFFIPTSD